MPPSFDGESHGVVAFHESRWQSRWLIVGLAVVLAWRSVTLIDREWIERIPWWLLLVLVGLAPQVFHLLFPLMTRIPNRLGSFGVGSARRWAVEFAIAIPVVIISLLLLACVNSLLDRLSPGASLRPEAFTNMAKSPDKIYVWLLLIFSVTFAPVAEETFFRGFLQNAFRARLHWVVATVTQSLIFGFAHFFGLLHSGAAFFLGIVMTLHYQWRKTLVAPILVHAGLNGMSAFGMILLMNELANSPFLGIVGNPTDTVCVVREVVPDSPAANAGFQEGDVIDYFNRQPVRDFPHFVRLLGYSHPEETGLDCIEPRRNDDPNKCDFGAAWL